MKSAMIAACLLMGQPSPSRAGPAAPETPPGPGEEEPETPPADTAGTALAEVWARAQEKFPDAVLLSINGRAGPDGGAVCSDRSPMTDGWRYHMHTAEKDKFLLLGRCGRSVEGPLVELRTVTPAEREPISGSFIDDDRALEILQESGVSLDPAEHGASGKRPFAFNLFRTADPRFADNPVFWEIRVGRRVFMVNAETQKLLRQVPGEYPAPQGSRGGAPAQAGAPRGAGVPAGAADGAGSSAPPPGGSRGSALDARPRRDKVYTALSDLQAVRAYVREHMRGSVLMGIDGIADAWGGVSCTGAGDGWAFYYHWPARRSVEAVFACGGTVSQGRATYVPVDTRAHREIEGLFIDSGLAMDLALGANPALMNEGMGRSFTRTLTMRLLRHRAPPLPDPKFAAAPLLWQIERGSEVLYVDAVKGIFLGSKAK